ncbi:MAG: glycosyltransferase family 2 protein [bacterium]|nr:glycosyltransferase family 2 protein [bacterium]
MLPEFSGRSPDGSTDAALTNANANANADADAECAPVSVVIPVAGRPQLLSEAIRSVSGGSLKPRELIVVLNAADSVEREADRAAAERCFQSGSEDAAAAAESPLRCRLVECESVGPGPARNAGVALASQPWLAFLDSDDLWAPEKLRRQWRYLQQRPHLRAAHTAEVWIKDGRELTQPAQLRPHTGRFLRASFRHCLISCSSLLMRRDVFLELGGFDPDFRVCEDFELWLRYLIRYPIGLVREVLTIKRAGDWPQESRRFHSLDALRIRAILKLLRTDAERLTIDELSHARDACETKLKILSQGARRRDRAGEVEPLIQEVEGEFRSAFRKARPGL